ncbi:hypothetical protein ES703_61675 [subsurface metagenome]
MIGVICVDIREVIPRIVATAPAHIEVVIQSRGVVAVSIANKDMSAVLSPNTESNGTAGIQIRVDHPVQPCSGCRVAPINGIAVVKRIL